MNKLFYEKHELKQMKKNCFSNIGDLEHDHTFHTEWCLINIDGKQIFFRAKF